MILVEKAQMWHLSRAWQAYADQLVSDERLGSWFQVDLSESAEPLNRYRPDGRRRSLDA